MALVNRVGIKARDSRSELLKQPELRVPAQCRIAWPMTAT
jgi:hypothetical protein